MAGVTVNMTGADSNGSGSTFKYNPDPRTRKFKLDGLPPVNGIPDKEVEDGGRVGTIDG